jgi:hypothetical protein
MSSAYPFDSLDRSDGNGSRNAEEDWLDENSTAAENQWSTAETTFYYWDVADSKQSHFEDLYNKHHGKGEDNRRSTIRRSHIVNDAETFVDILELPRPQRQRVVELAETMDFSTKRFGGKPYEKILLAICSLVADQALSSRIGRFQSSGNAIEQRIIENDSFEELMDVNNLDSREHNRIRQMLRTKTDYFD